MSRDPLIHELRAIVGKNYLLIEKEDVIVYEQDGSIFQVMPEIVVVPGDVDQVAAVVKAAKRANVPIVPRGSGTGLAGGAVPAEGGIVLSLARLRSHSKNRSAKPYRHRRTRCDQYRHHESGDPRMASFTHLTPAAKSPVPSAAMLPTIPAARTPLPTA